MDAARGQARERAAGELKSLVASPLHWLPKDQQGAKSTQGRRKWMGFRNGGDGRGDSERWGDEEREHKVGINWEGDVLFSLCLSSTVTQG